MGMLLRYPYEVRDSSEYFDDIQERKDHEGYAGSCPAYRRAEVR
jgi:non-homologous end joining protein Ku